MELLRWKIVNPSQNEWKRSGMDFIRHGLSPQTTYCVWENFRFHTPDGAICEVELLVLTQQGFWLVEQKEWTGRISGDPYTWTLAQDGRIRTEHNPLLSADRNVRALSSLLHAQPATDKVQLPFLEALIFLSADDVQCDLTGTARNRILLKDQPDRNGIIAALSNRTGPGIDPIHPVIDIKAANALSRAIEQAGIGSFTVNENDIDTRSDSDVRREAELLMQEAQQWVQQKRKEGWTREDFLHRLSEIFGMEVEHKDG